MPVASSIHPDLCGFLETLLASLSADGAILSSLDSRGDTKTLALAGTESNDPDFLDAAWDWANTAAQSGMHRPSAGGGTVFWSDCDVGGRGGRAMSLVFGSSRSELVLLSALYRRGSDIVPETAEASAGCHYSLIEGYVRLWRERRAEHRKRMELEVALDLGGVAVAVLDREGSVCYANAAMRRLVSAADGLRLHGRSLVASDLPSAVRLQVAIQHAVAQASDGTGSSDGQALSLVCRRPRATHGLPVAVSAVRHSNTEPDEPTVVIHAIDPDADLAHLVRPLCVLHSLSPVETALVLNLVSGQTLSQAAQLMRVKTQTARSYLKQVFSKTETNRQADLVRLMLSSLLRLESAITGLPN